MKVLHIRIEMPEDVEVSSVCKTSGKIALPVICPETETEYFAEGTEPSEKCRSASDGSDLQRFRPACRGILSGEQQRDKDIYEKRIR